MIPVTPEKLAGWRIEPPVSVPVAAGSSRAATAAAEPRIHHQWMPDVLQMEEGFSPDTVRLLREMGQPVNLAQRTSGRTNSIMLEGGWLFGSTDTRRPGGWVAGY